MRSGKLVAFLLVRIAPRATSVQTVIDQRRGEGDAECYVSSIFSSIVVLLPTLHQYRQLSTVGSVGRALGSVDWAGSPIMAEETLVC